MIKRILSVSIAVMVVGIAHAQTWVPGHYTAPSKWVPGHTTKGGKWVEGHYTAPAKWVDGHWTKPKKPSTKPPKVKPFKY